MQPIHLSVFSETARLKQVVIHNPGPEVDLMVPGMMEKLLFDDILHGDLARYEHEQFRKVLAKVADEVLDIQDLFIESLQDQGVKLAFIEDLRRLVGLPDDTCNLLRDMAPADAARSVIGGLPWDDMPGHTRWEEEFDYRVRPIPNLLFMRDPASVIGDGYSVNSMATWAREREPLILSYVFRHHPRLKHHTDQDKWFDQVTPLVRGEIKAPVSLEGGDILVLSRKVLAVGCSERTQADAIHLLAESLRAHRAENEDSFDHLLMVLMPKKRSAMHLDTIFTRTSEGECLVYPPYFLEGSRELLNVTSVDLRHPELRMSTQPSLLRSLKAVGVDLQPIFCGGKDPILQQREQWTDGANAFCLAPGVIASYARNIATGEALDKAGYRVVTAQQVLTEAGLDLLDGRKYLIQIEAGELSRARGGPRCMTMPLSREGA
ncbi:arginine deiminase [Geothrix oryzae]|uniref:arginine deiminase n=1 Tax=Geothrix oryzae TaxID=2927975 RepID=A0ABM8DNF3_9BACT|nr:arginine deiminase family protein [Geothrix oryzae]BDU68430.1 arginine deiminase [Geothrix oryzae]